MASNPDPLDFELIRATIATYCVALDTKKFALFNDIFTEDVQTVYPFKGEIEGRQAVADAISNRLKPVTTQHALTTQLIDIESAEQAKATTYFTGIHFGTGKWEGKDVSAWGVYHDDLVCLAGEGGRKRWLIARREVRFMGRRGEEGVMEGE